MADKVKILVADDDAQIRGLVARVLGGDGFHCLQATSGDEAIEAVKKERPDLLLLDISMPGCNGFEVCQALRKNPENSRMAIVMLTGRDKESDIVKALESGADDYVGKPFNQTELLSKINKLLEKAKTGLLPSQHYFKRTGGKTGEF
ncbi:MAG: response regulator transcription factor [Candidatus Omnitrophota bacterium]